MKALIIGAAGFVGRYLTDHLHSCSWSVCATKMNFEQIDFLPPSDVYDLDILQPQQIVQLLDAVRPDCIFHLAAQSSVAVSWKNPALTVDVNVKGALQVLDAVRALDYKPRVMLIGSGEEYGHIRENEVPVSEENATRPGNIYAVTKVAQNLLGKVYADAYGMDIVMVRAFNHIGPNQIPQFVVADFCKQVADIEAGLREAVIHVGNLSAKRDFADVRDVVAAYERLARKGASGETYNIGSGEAVEVRALLDLILSFARTPIAVEVDSERLRPVDVPIIEADISKLVQCTGWERKYSLEQTVKETLDYWRKQVQ